MRLPQAMNGPNQHGAAEQSSSAVLRWWCFALTAQQVSGLELRQWKWETCGFPCSVSAGPALRVPRMDFLPTQCFSGLLRFSD